MVAIRLSKAGYGTIEEILNMRADLVLAALDYEKFLPVYEATFMKRNTQT